MEVLWWKNRLAEELKETEAEKVIRKEKQGNQARKGNSKATPTVPSRSDFASRNEESAAHVHGSCSSIASYIHPTPPAPAA
jgi:hypothetical protein